MTHKRNPTRGQAKTDLNYIKWGIERAFHKTQELVDAMKATDARTQQANCDRCSVFNKDEFKLLTEIVDIVISLLPMMTRLLKWAVPSHKPGG